MKSLASKRGAIVGTALTVALAIAGATAGPGKSATMITPTLTRLIGATTGVPQVSPGGNIAYQLDVSNTGDSTVTQVTVTVAADVATFLDDLVLPGAVAPTCAGAGSTLTCVPPSGKMAPGDHFTVDVRFQVPATTTAATVITTATVTVAAQSVGGSSNNGTVLSSTNDSIAIVPTAVSSFSTFLRAGDPAQTDQTLTTTHPQDFRITFPGSLNTGVFGAPLSLLDNNASQLCATCLPWHTTVTVPPGSSVGTTAGNPFFDGTNAYPYSWTMRALYPPGFKLTGVYYLPDNALTPVLLLACSGSPTAGAPLCYQTLVQDPKTKTLTATGLGIENGNLGFG